MSEEVKPVEQEPVTKENYPSLDLAYEIALESFRIGERRFDGSGERAERLLSLIVAVNAVGMPLLASKGATIGTIWIVVAVCLLAGAMGLAMCARSAGKFTTLSPGELREKWLTLPQDRFKADLIGAAQAVLDDNSAVIDKRWRFQRCATICLILEVGAVAWGCLHP